MRDDNVVDDMVFEELRGISDLLLFLGHSDLALASFDGGITKIICPDLSIWARTD
jgi:hypothetical protein